jgi:hypothetical protein
MGSPRHLMRVHSADVPMKILTVDEAIEAVAFPATADPPGKDAFLLLDNGKYAFVTSDDGDEATGRWDLAEEFVLGAIRFGKLKLLGRSRAERAQNTGAAEELSVVDLETIRARTMDRWEGDVVLLTADENGEYEADDEIVDLHVFEDELNALAGHLFSFRAEKDRDAPAAPASFGPPVLVHSGVPTIGAETECAEWFKANIPEAPGKGPGKHAMWDEARKKFGTRLSSRAFSRIWDQHAPIEWKRAGRKPGRIE